MKKKSKRETIGWVIALAAVPFVAFVAVAIWAYGYSYRYKEFKDDLARDFAYAQANDCLTATENGVSTRLTSRNSDYIWREIAEGEFAGYKEDAMEEPVIELDFGNGQPPADLRCAGCRSGHQERQCSFGKRRRGAQHPRQWGAAAQYRASHQRAVGQ